MQYRFSATQWIYGNEPIEVSMARLQKYGYEGIEFAAEPYTLDVDLLSSLLDKFELKCSTLCGIYKEERNLSSSDPHIRKTALKYVKDSIDMAVNLKAPAIIVVPSAIGKLSPDESYEKAWELGILSVREAADYAKEKGIYLALEAVNRYETFLLRNLSLACSFLEEVNHPSVGLMADLFHMNLEERDISKMLINIKNHLIHVHIADNTREAAGLGSTNFKEAVATLRKINYKGWLTMEFMPSVSDPYSVSTQSQNAELLDQFTMQSISYMRTL